MQFIEQFLGFLQIPRVEALSEPAVNRSQQFARLLHLALVAPEPCEARSGARFAPLAKFMRGESDLKPRLRQNT